MNIIIVSSNHKCNKLSKILEFIGVAVKVVSPFNFLEFENNTDAVIIDINQIDKPTQTINLINSIKSPVILLTKYSNEKKITSKNVIGFYSYPINQRMIFSMLDEIKDFNNNSISLVDKRFIGKSCHAKKIRNHIKKASKTFSNVLINGDSGVGKEIVARTIHDLSEYSSGPFVPINCSAIPSELLESELFGHEKGAFTGAVSTYKGRFECAEGGTLFLDEIGDMPMDMQVKLLRVLQEKEFQRVGGCKTIKANVRIICATHRNLEKMINNGEFRLDLFHRLNVFPIFVPNLHARKNDIDDLIFIIKKKNINRGYNDFSLSSSAIKCLKKYLWPGNVRELENLIERLAISYPSGNVDVYDLPVKYREHMQLEPKRITDNTDKFSDINTIPEQESKFHPIIFLKSGSLNLKQTLANIEVDVIKSALYLNGKNVAKTARFLKMQRTTLIDKIRKYALDI